MGIGDIWGSDGMGNDDGDEVKEEGSGGGLGSRVIQKVDRRPRIKSNTVLVITEIGRSESERMDLPPRKQRILGELKEQGAMTLGRLCRELGVPENMVRHACEGLLYEKCIQISGGGD